MFLILDSLSKKEGDLYSCIGLSLMLILSSGLFIALSVLWFFFTPDENFVMIFVYGIVFVFGLGFILISSRLIAESYILIQRRKMEV